MEIQVMLNTPSLPLLPGPLKAKVVVPVRAPYMYQIELFDHLALCKQMTNVKLNLWCYEVHKISFQKFFLMGI